MKDTLTQPRIAVVGFGPRGLGALEALAAEMQGSPTPLQIDIFDPFPAPGAGPNFDPDESPLCRLNIPMRDIDIRPPEIPSVGPFAKWQDGPTDPDAFPPRAELGRYLEDRHAKLRALDALSITLLDSEIDAVKPDPDGWRLRAKGGWHGPYAEVLLVPGQPETAPDDQLAEWQRHVKSGPAALASAYPARILQQRAAGWAGKSVGIRGLALSAFDVLRVLTTGQGGRFDEGRYLASGREPARILPFSLDGQPPSPKPATEALDARFDPTPAETDTFARAISRAASGPADLARAWVNGALLPPVRRILAETGGDADAVPAWLDTEWTDPGSQDRAAPMEALRRGIAMAEATLPPSVGYVVGQVWRKWQDPLRVGYNPANTPAETARLLTGFDEGLKRYSYGPPVSSSRELVALIEAGIVSLDFATDPGIATAPGGWNVTAEDRSAEVDVMIDAVLPSPDLAAIRAPLIAGLVSEGRMTPCGDKLAAQTAGDGTLIGSDGARSRGLCLLGRLALGSVIAVDSLHDCFGEASRRWARGVTDRIGPPQETEPAALPPARSA